MSFGGLFDNGAGGLPYGGASMTTNAISQPRLLLPTVPRPAYGSPGLSLGLGDSCQMGGIAIVGDVDSAGGNKEDENESRSGSDNLEAGSGDDLDQENPRKKKRYHRHTPQQIHELEALFKKCPHPDEKQRLELSKRLCLDPRQVKFWFQNRRTQMKTQMERHENSILRQENDKLRMENMTIRDAMRNPICNSCGGPAMLGEVSMEEQHLRFENARLRDELDRVCALAGKFLGRPISSLANTISPTLPSSILELGVGSNGFSGLNSIHPTMPVVPDYLPGMASLAPPVLPPARNNVDGALSGNERSMFLELALSAMEELVNMAQMEAPLWIPSLDGSSMERLNYEEYNRSFNRIIGMSPIGYASEASRETGMVTINSLALVETLMDAARWADIFPSMIARTTTTYIISSGFSGTRNGALQLMHAELQVLSPLVPVREVSFLRFAKQHAEGIWAVVDISIDSVNGGTLSSPAGTFPNCRRLPSGCVVQDMPNGYSKVTWVEHVEYDESSVHQLYRQLLRSGLAFGARRWVATLQRQCQCLAILMSSNIVTQDETAIVTSSGRRSMLKLAQRMTNNFCAGVCASSAHEWNKLPAENLGDNVRVMTRKSINDPGEPAGVVLSVATSVWIPVSPRRLFDFLQEGGLRGEWDILSNGGPMHEMTRIAKGQDTDNAVSLLRATPVNGNQNCMLILQETCTDASGSMVVYAPVDVPAMHVVMSGGDSSYVALLPSGFVILPDGASYHCALGHSQSNGISLAVSGASLLTVAFQILVNNQPAAKLTVESVETVKNLISCTIQKIKAALQCEN